MSKVARAAAQGLCVVLLLAGCGSALAQPLVLLGDKSIPPFESLEGGVATGVNVELMNALSRAIGRPITYRLQDWQKAQEEVLAGKADGLGLMIPTSERRKLYSFTKPTFPFAFSMFVRTSDLDDFAEKPLAMRRVGATPGGLPYVHLKAQYPDLPVVAVDDYAEGMRRLLRGELDAFAAGTVPGNNFLRELGISGIAPLAHPFFTASAAIAIPHGNTDLLAQLNAGLTQLQEDGTLDRLIDRLSTRKVTLVTDREVWLIGTLGAVGVLVLLLLGLLLVLSRRKTNRIEAEIVHRQRMEEALRAQEARLRATFQAVSEGVISLSKDGGVLAMNPAFAELHEVGTANPTTIGWFVDRFELRGLDGKDFAYEERPFVRALRGQFVRNLEVEVRRRSDQTFCFLGRYNATPVTSPDGTIEQVVLTVHDFTDRYRGEQRQRLLSQEVDHRARNALAVVQAIMHLTRAETVQEFQSSVRSRIETLARSHARLSESRWLDVDLRALIQDELLPFEEGRSDRIKVEGPRVGIAAGAVQPLSMVFHELATNAAKYGSLSVKQGELRIEWTLSSDALHLTWTETAGPACSRPSRRGVGSAVIAGSMAQVGGRVEKEWNPEGLVCRLELPVESVIASEGRQVQTAARPRDQGASSLQGERILIVEDDALLAAELVQTLDAFGCQAVGPAATLEEALRMASGEERLSAAVLDVNLGGRQSELVAKVLKARGVPYVMATGYAEITWTEPGVRLLQKPYPPATLAEALRAAIGSRSELADRADWQ